MKRILAILLLFSLVVLFQNCSNVGRIVFVDLGSNEAPPDSKGDPEGDSGNNTGYGGKLPGDYYHYVPGYRCENHESAFSKIEYKPNEVNSVYLQSTESKCLSVPSAIPSASLDAGSMQNKVIGHEEKIFETNPSEPSIIPERPVEIWCVDKWVNPGVEIISTYNQTVKQAETEFYFPSMSKHVESNPARTTGLQTVQLTSNYFDLLIDKRVIGLKPGTFEGNLNIFSDKSTVQKLQCRLGSYLDARLWPAKAVNYDNFMQTEWSASEGLFYIISGMSGASTLPENRVYSYSPSTESKKVIVGDVLNSRGADSFQFSPDRSKMILRAHLSGDSAIQLYSKSVSDILAPIRLNTKLTDWGQSVYKEAQMSSNAQYIYYMDGAQETGGDIEHWLRMVDSNTGQVTQINHDLPLGGDVDVNNYEVLNSLNKVVYSAGFVFKEIWVTDMLGNGRHKIDLTSYLGVNLASGFGGTKYYLGVFVKENGSWLIANDRYLVLLAQSSLSTYSSALIVIDMQTEQIVLFKEMAIFGRLFKVNGLPAVGIASYTATGGIETQYVNLNLPAVVSDVELINDFKNSSVSAEKQSAINLGISKSSSLCPVSGETSINKIQLNDQTWLAINKNSQNLASLYLLTSASANCKLINRINFSAELTGTNLQGRISSDLRNLLLAIKGRLYLIPTDLHPIIEVYTASNLSPSFHDFGFISNSKIYFKGPLIKDFWNQLFLWDIPIY